MAYICNELGTNPETGHIECLQWVFYQSSGFLPELSTADKDNLLLWMIGIFMVVFTLKQLRKMFGA